jgi:ribosomal protein S18 acetylase RimI-like enzyme
MTLRSIKMPGDLETLKAVAYESFQYPENPDWGLQEDERESATSELDALRRMWPLLRAVGWMYPPIRDLFAGYIWEEEGRAAGLVMVQPVSVMGSPAWVVGTVCVLPDFRRRGIARRLVQAGLELARQKGARTIMLDVFSQNIPAYRLYESLGFSHIASGVELVRDPESSLPEPCLLPAGYTIARAPRSEWRPRYELVRRITPDEVRAFRPVEKRNFHPPLLMRWVLRLVSLLGGSTERIYVVRDTEQVVAIARYQARKKAGGRNRLSVQIDPEHAELGPYLVAKLIHEVDERSPGRWMAMAQLDWWSAANEAALRMGFTTRKEWHEMGLVMD